MKITLQKISKLIREAGLREALEDHIYGITQKIAKLEQELKRQQSAMRKTYDNTQSDVEQLMPGPYLTALEKDKRAIGRHRASIRSKAQTTDIGSKQQFNIDKIRAKIKLLKSQLADFEKAYDPATDQFSPIPSLTRGPDRLSGGNFEKQLRQARDKYQKQYDNLMGRVDSQKGYQEK